MKLSKQALKSLDRIEQLLEKHLPGQHNQMSHGGGGSMAADTGGNTSGGGGKVIEASSETRTRTALPNEVTSQVVLKLVDKYPKPSGVSSMQNMGNSVLFSDDATVQTVRGWLDSTKLKKMTARKYGMDLPNDLRLECEIDKSTYGIWAVHFTLYKLS